MSLQDQHDVGEDVRRAERAVVVRRAIAAIEGVPTHHDSLAGFGERTATAFAADAIAALAALLEEPTR